MTITVTLAAALHILGKSLFPSYYTIFFKNQYTLVIAQHFWNIPVP